MDYRRDRTPGGTHFFTVVTHDRRPFLTLPENLAILRFAFKTVRATHPFEINAIAILPEHLHCILTLPQGDADFSTRWRLIKTTFSRQCDPKLHGQRSTARQKKQERAIWQRRFWEHRIRGDRDFKNHVDYIYYNPVKHGLVELPKDWPHSSFQRDINSGHYDRHWGASPPANIPQIIGME